MIIEARKQKNLGPIAVALFIAAILMYMPTLIRGIDQTNETGVSGGHANHEDTLSVTLPSNCPCGYRDCGGCGGTVAITLEVTPFVTALPTLVNPATPDIPGDIPLQLTVFPTLAVDPLPTLQSTLGVPTLMPTVLPGPIETIIPPVSVDIIN